MKKLLCLAVAAALVLNFSLSCAETFKAPGGGLWQCAAGETTIYFDTISGEENYYCLDISAGTAPFALDVPYDDENTYLFNIEDNLYTLTYPDNLLKRVYTSRPSDVKQEVKDFLPKELSKRWWSVYNATRTLNDWVYFRLSFVDEPEGKIRLCRYNYRTGAFASETVGNINDYQPYTDDTTLVFKYDKFSAIDISLYNWVTGKYETLSSVPLGAAGGFACDPQTLAIYFTEGDKLHRLGQDGQTELISEGNPRQIGPSNFVAGKYVFSYEETLIRTMDLSE